MGVADVDIGGVRQEGYDDGYNVGYGEGYDEGERVGWDNGYEEGYNTALVETGLA
jgi:flagellar biosynthesis/type III secretory pathway protein FliH